MAHLTSSGASRPDAGQSPLQAAARYYLTSHGEQTMSIDMTSTDTTGGKQTPRGFALISYWAADLEAAKSWYADLLGIAPYFERAFPGDERPAYYEFRIGDYEQELGLIDRRFAPPGLAAGPGGVVVYWHVDDVRGTFQRLLAMGATELEGPKERGEGFVTASVVDPFGNVLGVMYNPHYVEVLGSRTGGAPRQPEVGA